MSKIQLVLLFLVLTVVLLSCSSNTDIDEKGENNDSDLIYRDTIDWTLEPSFEHDNFIFVGDPGKIGVFNLSESSNKFFSNEQAIFNWRFYGDPNEFEKELGELGNPNKVYGQKLKIIGLHKETDTSISMFEEDKEIYIVRFHSPNKINGVSKGIQIQEVMSLPEEGTWNMMVYINQELFDSVTIQVGKRGNVH